MINGAIISTDHNNALPPWTPDGTLVNERSPFIYPVDNEKLLATNFIEELHIKEAHVRNRVVINRASVALFD